jgi:ubiquinone/menaquinone biosynthesis C-methylase UbiE
MNDYTEINSKTWDVWAKNGNCWSIPVTHEVFTDAGIGKWDVILTPCKPVPKRWYEPFIKNNRLDGTRLLGLASGGGQQMPIFSALGAECTVLDYSDSQLDSERTVAAREGYAINIVKQDMAKPLPFEDESFDIIFHPVSNCYVEDVHHVWNECFRILKSGGVLMAGMDNGFNFIVGDFTVRPLVITNKLPFNPLKMPDEQFQKMAENYEGIQFSHTFEEQIGGQIKAGFILTDVFEDFNNDPDAISDGIPAYWASRAVKPFHAENGMICISGIDEE